MNLGAQTEMFSTQEGSDFRVLCTDRVLYTTKHIARRIPAFAGAIRFGQDSFTVEFPARPVVAILSSLCGSDFRLDDLVEIIRAADYLGADNILQAVDREHPPKFTKELMHEVFAKNLVRSKRYILANLDKFDYATIPRIALPELSDKQIVDYVRKTRPDFESTKYILETRDDAGVAANCVHFSNTTPAQKADLFFGLLLYVRGVYKCVRFGERCLAHFTDAEFSDREIKCADGSLRTTNHYLRECGLELPDSIEEPREMVAAMLVVAHAIQEGHMGRVSHGWFAKNRRRIFLLVERFGAPHTVFMASLWAANNCGGPEPNLLATMLANNKNPNFQSELPPWFWEYVYEFGFSEGDFRSLAGTVSRSQIDLFYLALYVSALPLEKKRELLILAETRLAA